MTEEAAAAQLLIEIAFLLPKGTDITRHPIAHKLLAYRKAVQENAVAQAETIHTIVDIQCGQRNYHATLPAEDYKRVVQAILP